MSRARQCERQRGRNVIAITVIHSHNSVVGAMLRLPQKRVRGSEGFEGFRVQISGSTPGVEAASA